MHQFFLVVGSHLNSPICNATAQAACVCSVWLIKCFAPQVPTQSQSLLKQPQTIYLTTRGNVFGQQQGRVVIPKLNIKVEPGTAGEPHCCIHLFSTCSFGISLNLSRNTLVAHRLTPRCTRSNLVSMRLIFLAIFRVPSIAGQPVPRMHCSNSLDAHTIESDSSC